MEKSTPPTETRRAGWGAIFAGFLGILTAGSIQAQEPFVRGDVNQDGRVSLADVARLNAHNFGTYPDGFPCRDAADTEDDGILAIQDAEWLFLRLFKTDFFEVPPPHGEADVDATDDGLECQSYIVEPATRTDEMLRLGDIEVTDAVRILRVYFGGEGRIPAPHPRPGRDGTFDTLPSCK